MKLRDYIKNLSSIKEELQDVEIKTLAENGLLLDPRVKFVLKDPTDALNVSKDNVETIIITY
jgi:repressor of nif and glnA expression